MFLMAWYFLISRWRSLICWLFESDTCFEVISENETVAVSSMTNGDIAHTYIVIYQLCFHKKLKKLSTFPHFPELFPENSHHVCPVSTISLVHHHLHVHQAHHTMFIMFSRSNMINMVWCAWKHCCCGNYGPTARRCHFILREAVIYVLADFVR